MYEEPWLRALMIDTFFLDRQRLPMNWVAIYWYMPADIEKWNQLYWLRGLPTGNVLHVGGLG